MMILGITSAMTCNLTNGRRHSVNRSINGSVQLSRAMQLSATSLNGLPTTCHYLQEHQHPVQCTISCFHCFIRSRYTTVQPCDCTLNPLKTTIAYHWPQTGNGSRLDASITVTACCQLKCWNVQNSECQACQGSRLQPSHCRLHADTLAQRVLKRPHSC